MSQYTFIDKKGTFTLENPEQSSYLYFPIAGEAGLKCAITPELGGDAKIDQNTFVLEPVSSENLHNNRSSRNFWCQIDGLGAWSATGASAEEQAKKFTSGKDKSLLEAGVMYHKLTRESAKYNLKSEITSFVTIDENVEIMSVRITNIGADKVTFTPTAAIPIYGRSADNIRDHRHVTSLLHRIKTTEYGVEVKPTLSFDERGHQINHMTYYVYGMDGQGTAPAEFYPVTEDYIGEGGNFEMPLSILQKLPGVKAGYTADGLEAVGALRFADKTLASGETAVYNMLIGTNDTPEKNADIIARFTSTEKTEAELAKVNAYWNEKLNVICETGDQVFDQFMYWVCFQPILRRVYGCSFLPHHDYGKGGRGWRDLWQDCLALLIMNPVSVRQMLVDNFAGVRMDGSNATIIGSRQGEFVADRNNITRVWMDHGLWPFMTTKFYLDQSGDLELLDEKVNYFKDKQIVRGTRTDNLWSDAYSCWQKTESGEIYQGTVLEHMLLQNLTVFYEVGEHNELRLRGADWNDAIDMAAERGESVAFTNAYAGNLRDLADVIEAYAAKTGKKEVEISAAMKILLWGDAEKALSEDEMKAVYTSIDKKLAILNQYLETCTHDITGEVVSVEIAALAENLRNKSAFMMEQIRSQEWVEDGCGNGWFNGYYDNNGRAVDGVFPSGVRMMLTGQVFAIMAGTASEEQIQSIVRSADQYLYSEEVGGYRLNTDFKEVKTDLGRMFGFSYGDKENGAVFSHMTVMYANALYRRGFVKEGYKAISTLEKQAVNFPVSRIYPGLPEYFNAKGRGMYNYLTGSASWYLMTVVTEMFGVRGELGNLVAEPKLVKEQFDENGMAVLKLNFAGKSWEISYANKELKEYGAYKVTAACLDGKAIEVSGQKVVISQETLEALSTGETHKIDVILA